MMLLEKWSKDKKWQLTEEIKRTMKVYENMIHLTKMQGNIKQNVILHPVE